MINNIENMEQHTESILESYTINELIKQYVDLLRKNEELVKENNSLKRRLENQKDLEDQKEKVEIPERADYEEVKDENDRIWYKRTHFRTQRKESRQLEKYDIIVTKNKLDDPIPNIFIIDSFDYDSDFAARILYGKHVFYTDEMKSMYNICWYGGGCPSNTYFSFATFDEIKELFDNMKKNEYSYKIILRNKEIVERYSQYLN